MTDQKIDSTNNPSNNPIKKISHITTAENTWCPGCGNFGILASINKAIDALETDEKNPIPKENLVMTTGIGCHGKIFDYLKLSGFYGLHGRALPLAEGMKLANPNLKPVVFVGDGDCFGEGIAHLIFAAKRNIDITVIVHDNLVYALTTGQFTPLSKKGFKSKTSPRGNVEEPLNPIRLSLECGATFVARGYSSNIPHLTDIIKQAIQHKGFSIINVMQICKTFNDLTDDYNEKIEILKDGPLSFDDAMLLALQTDKIPIGVFYKIDRPSYSDSFNIPPDNQKISSEKRKELVRELL